jgi:hypothetical protein
MGMAEVSRRALVLGPVRGIMPVIKDQITTPSAGIMPDMQGDRGADLPDQRASRSPPYHHDRVFVLGL